jgi:hypothetical protein
VDVGLSSHPNRQYNLRLHLPTRWRDRGWSTTEAAAEAGMKHKTRRRKRRKMMKRRRQDRPSED